MTVDHELIRARVRLFLEGGCTYNEALRRAYLEPAPTPASGQPWNDPTPRCAHGVAQDDTNHCGRCAA